MNDQEAIQQLAKDLEVIKTGYHYTTKENWDGIKATGEMIPYEIHHPQVQEHVKDAIWMWRNRPRGISHMGNIIYQAAKGHVDVVMLSIKYFEFELCLYPRKVNIYHQGSVGELHYHENDLATLMKGPIKVSRITCMHEYNLEEMPVHYEKRMRRKKNVLV